MLGRNLDAPDWGVHSPSLVGRALKEDGMTNKRSRLLFCVILVGLTSAWMLAQDSDANTKSKDEVRTISGCLTKSGNGNEFLLTASDGSTWEIRGNSSVDLASNVGQKVEAKGVVAHDKAHNMKEDAKQMGNDAGVKNNTAEHGHFKVTDLRKTGDSCEQ
jgi:hypothetical protein